jgi:hypothetical protein
LSDKKSKDLYDQLNPSYDIDDSFKKVPGSKQSSSSTTQANKKSTGKNKTNKKEFDLEEEKETE